MKILALEFSSPQRTVAVLDSETGSAAEVLDAGDSQSMKPFDLIEQALKQAKLEREQIETIVIGLGPGSYTGIRIAIALAQGWQLARGVKLCGISSVECLATQAAAMQSIGRFNVIVDAQRGEFYLATYEISADSLRTISALQIVSSATVKARELAGERLIGPEVTGWFPGGHQVFPQAATLAKMAAALTDFIPGEKLEPIYLRETAFVKAAHAMVPRA